MSLTVTIDDPELAQAILRLAEERRLSASDLVLDALRGWLEELEDLRAIEEVEDEERVPWSRVQEDLRRARSANGG